MRYICFKIGEKDLCVDTEENYEFDPTLINKVGPTTQNILHDEMITGMINYKGRLVDVLDISKLYNQENLKKFDGILFISGKDDLFFGIEYEGFHKESPKPEGDILNIDKLVEKIRS